MSASKQRGSLMPRFACQSSNNLQAYRLLPALALAKAAAVAAAQNASPANLLPSSPQPQFMTAQQHTEAGPNSLMLDGQHDSVERPSGASTPPAPANTGPAEAQTQTWNWHMQSTITGQGYPSLSAKERR